MSDIMKLSKMHGFLIEGIGYAAAFFGTILMLPQTYKSYKTKRVADISLSMLVVYVINCTLWEVYGWLIDSNPIIICNIIALFIGIIQLIIKIKYGKYQEILSDKS